MHTQTGLPKLPELAEHLTRGLGCPAEAPAPRPKGVELLEGHVCLDSVDVSVSASRVTQVKEHERPLLEQCEICHRWSRDVAYVPEICGDAIGGNLVCGACEREAVAKFEGDLREIFPGAKVLREFA